MGLTATQIYQLQTLLSNTASGLAPAGSAPAQGAEANRQAAQSGIQGEAIKKAKKEEEKKNKGGFLGEIGGALGSMAGVALAPLTGGTSLAATAAFGAAGGMVGTAAGEYAGGGEIDPVRVGVAGLMGGIGGGVNAYTAKNAATAAVAPVAGIVANKADMPIQSSVRASAQSPAAASAPVTGPQTPSVPVSATNSSVKGIGGHFWDTVSKAFPDPTSDPLGYLGAFRAMNSMFNGGSGGGGVSAGASSGNGKLPTFSFSRDANGRLQAGF